MQRSRGKGDLGLFQELERSLCSYSGVSDVGSGGNLDQRAGVRSYRPSNPRKGFGVLFQHVGSQWRVLS